MTSVPGISSLFVEGGSCSQHAFSSLTLPSNILLFTICVSSRLLVFPFVFALHSTLEDVPFHASYLFPSPCPSSICWSFILPSKILLPTLCVFPFLLCLFLFFAGFLPTTVLVPTLCTAFLLIFHLFLGGFPHAAFEGPTLHDLYPFPLLVFLFLSWSFSLLCAEKCPSHALYLSFAPCLSFVFSSFFRSTFEDFTVPRSVPLLSSPYLLVRFGSFDLRHLRRFTVDASCPCLSPCPFPNLGSCSSSYIRKHIWSRCVPFSPLPCVLLSL